MRQVNNLNRPRVLFNDVIPALTVDTYEFPIFIFDYLELGFSGVRKEYFTVSKIGNKFKFELRHIYEEDALTTTFVFSYLELKHLWSNLIKKDTRRYHPTIKADKYYIFLLKPDKTRGIYRTLGLNTNKDATGSSGLYSFTPATWKEFKTLIKTLLAKPV